VNGPTRRDFLRITATAGGALAIGIFLPGCRGHDPATAARADQTGEFMPNAWLRVLPDDRIVFYLDRVEMGQGTMTSHPTILAEELDVDPRKLHVEHAIADRAYDVQDPAMSVQMTGGSMSVRTSWMPLRRAGATAREMLRQAAAATWGVALEECVADDGAIRHARSDRRATYGELTRAAAHQPVPKDPPLKDPSAFKWLGKSSRRLDNRMKVDGSGVYGIDVRAPEMLSALVIRPPTVRGRVRSFDGAAAKRQPGIVDVFEIPTGVAVVATSLWRAKAAVRHVQVTWDAGPLASLSTATLRERYRKLSRQEGKPVRDEGDLDGALRAPGAKVLEAVYEVPYLAHATMEPQNCTAHFQGDRCELWAPTQGPGAVRAEIAREFGLIERNITVHTTLLGGGFGRRGVSDFAVEAAHVSRRVGKPVKVVWSREDDMRNDFYRPMTCNLLRGAIDARGEVSGWLHRIVAQPVLADFLQTALGAMLPNDAPEVLRLMLGRNVANMFRSATIPDPGLTENASDFNYTLPNLRVELTLQEPGVPTGFWRSVASSENVFVVESFLDELIHAAGRDPYQARRHLLRGAPRPLAALDLAARKAGWGAPAPRGVFRGIAQATSFGSHCAQVAEVSVEGGALRVRRVVAAIDCGFAVNPDLVRAQVESAIVFGLSAAMKQAITLDHGRVEQGNFHEFKLLRMHESPEIEVHIVPSQEAPTGVGEPGVPPIAPAVTNAIFAATGKRIRSLPIEPELAKGG
jgi:CO/xanthine dehydrogenase Mo-binding subunit